MQEVTYERDDERHRYTEGKVKEKARENTFVHLFIHSFIKYLFGNYYRMGTTQ